MKTCPRCNQSKSAESFGKDRSRKDGLDSYCLECRRLGCEQTEVPPKKRKCRKCGVTKPIEKFNRTKKRKDGRETFCMFCRAPHRRKDSEAYIIAKAKASAWNKNQRRNVKLKLIAMLGGQCVDCGLTPSDEWPIACFDVHHDDPSRKEFDFARKIAIASMIETVTREAAKCSLLCANCHRRRHAKVN